MSRRPRPVIDRIMAKVTEAENGCWVYGGSITANGYGTVSLGSRADGRDYTHRVTYRSLVGDIPPTLDIDHLCRNRRCCNPAHLEPVTRQVNVQRGRLFYSPISACRRAGHPYTEDNTYRLPSGARVCRTCQVERYHARRNAA